MERKEFFLAELPAELLDVYEYASMGLEMGCVGFTLDGVRYRIYRDERQKAAAKECGVDIMDALKWADVPAADVEAGMDKLGFGTEDRRVILAEIVQGQVSRAKAVNPFRADAQIEAKG